MAIDQTNVVLDLADASVQDASKFLDALARMEESLDHGVGAGINFTDYDADLADSAVSHVDGATLNKLLSIVAPAVRTYLQGTYTGGSSYEAILYKARK